MAERAVFDTDDGQVLVTRWDDGSWDLALRAGPSGVWGPPHTPVRVERDETSVSALLKSSTGGGGDAVLPPLHRTTSPPPVDPEAA